MTEKRRMSAELAFSSEIGSIRFKLNTLETRWVDPMNPWEKAKFGALLESAETTLSLLIDKIDLANEKRA